MMAAVEEGVETKGSTYLVVVFAVAVAFFFPGTPLCSFFTRSTKAKILQKKCCHSRPRAARVPAVAALPSSPLLGS